MKRKDLEDDILDHFSDISLSAPSRKSRRLDWDLLPVIEQNDISTDMFQMDAPAIDVLPLESNSEERALVLYNPKSLPFFKSPSSPDFSVIVNSDLIPGLKDHILWQGHKTPRPVKTMEDEMARENTKESNDCLAVVPWIASKFPTLTSEAEAAPATVLSGPMEAEEVEAEMMDIEDLGFGGAMGGTEGLQMWYQQQQQCMTPQFLQSTSNPVTW